MYNLLSCTHVTLKHYLSKNSFWFLYLDNRSNLESATRGVIRRSVQTDSSNVNLEDVENIPLTYINVFKTYASIYGSANKDWSTVSYCQSSAFPHPYLSSNDHCDWLLFQEVFLLILLLYPRNSFEWSWTCFLGI